MNPQVCEEGAGQPRQFATTRWSLILSAANSQSEEQKARDALEELCRIYWRPVFVFVCRRGYSMEDAKDLTQDFFLKILEPHWLQHADRNRGRFRTLLLTSLQNFLVSKSICAFSGSVSAKQTPTPIRRTGFQCERMLRRAMSDGHA